MALFKPDMKFLVVDSFPTMRRLLGTLLNQLGYPHVVEAQNGKQAIDALLNDCEIGFIIANWNMPQMSGFELLQRVRLNPDHKRLPFLMVLTESERLHAPKAVASGVSSCLIKPFTAQVLGETIKKIEHSYAKEAS